MPTRPIHYCAGLSAALIAGLGSAPPAHAATWHLVRPGESIQQAVDAAAPGDGIQLMAGTYRGSVAVGTANLTIRGVGEATVLTPDESGAAATGSAAACAAAGHGLCVTGSAAAPVSGVRIEALTLRGFPKNGLNASMTDRLRVRAVLAEGNGQQGISQEKSTRAEVTGNQARDNGQAGIFLANAANEEGGAIDTQGALISGNRLSGNRIGVVVRRARELTVERNDISGNCGGVFVVGDEGLPRAGALSVEDNYVHANNAYCPPNPRLDFIQGTGILLTGVEDTRVTGNRVEDNEGASPMSGGIVLFRSVVGTPSSRVTVEGNTALRNGPADLADRDTGTDNSFARNTCRTSEPAGHC
ncbi:right-handed parallel beta-helix repeat-containing protein [Kitasatospora sp. NPDC048540]|uniref:right-handed parallel beta-helix repeat-containing protein n=1 Tax=unclassified Kitasatospora TaxID=2633591 RepID=UPI00053A0D0B|nr:right-handed parallel beta-helix repeat-containing protein [Kitasatospora sp. MBT63]